MSDYPHVPAAFINAIREEGTKAEACDYLQKQWNETCALRAESARLREALTPGADTKAAYMGEFYMGITLRHPRTGEEYRRKLQIPWDSIKEIMAAIRARAALAKENGNE